ncbi:dcabddb8-0bfd-406f-8eba-432be23c9e89 [Thermothielavioides terrestris]|uniref:Dcabddb8-0bfd-406f-8eba-432be23c9e89 n=1 Tax=Thermothielavioides terrestris TaxID=2587410 RepID=A0A446BUY3_9PEZI|nr:dcabddb8-0bfd-406f-8eba-432be23c9e89 [Thermothielavioides terrestris]
MCRDKWYRYTCGHLIAARDDQEGFEHCAEWVEGRDETECANFDATADHATEDVETTCQDDMARSDALPPLDSPTGQSMTNPLRVVVRCISHQIPGPRKKRKATMANIICQHCFGRDHDQNLDTINIAGLEDIDGKKLWVLLDSGPPSASVSSKILSFRWTGKQLQSRPVDARTKERLSQVPFRRGMAGSASTKKDTKSRSMSSAELRDSMTDDQWNRYMQEFLKRKLQYEKVACNLVKDWARKHPTLFFDVMQEYTAQKRWHKLSLSLAEQQWVDAEKSRDQPASFMMQMEAVLSQMVGEET